MLVFTRAVAKELFILDASLSALLFYAHFDVFFRGLALTDTSVVHAFSNDAVYSLQIPSIEWLSACPIRRSLVVPLSAMFDA